MSNNYFSSSPYGDSSNASNMGMGMNFPFYNPMSPQLNRYQELTQQQQQMRQPQTNVDWVQVPNIQKAKEQIVQPNTTVWMMDSFLPQIYVKNVSNVGTIDFKAYQLVEINDGLKNSNSIIPMPIDMQTQLKQNNEDFVPFEKFNKLESDFNMLQNKVLEYETLFKNNLMQNETKETVKTSSRRGGANNESTK